MMELKINELAHCTLCPRACGVNRLAGERGYCGAVGEKVDIALVSLHPWEEPCIAGKNGAGTVFFSHCSLRCVFCQNSEISSEGKGIAVEVPRLAEIFLEQQERGAATLDLVTPTHYAPQIAEALRIAKRNGLAVPVVWNSGGYETEELIDALDGFVDVYLPDMKYIDKESAARYSHAEDYFENAEKALRAMVQQTGAPKLDAEGVMQRGVLVRHLVLPGRRKESMRIIDWLWETFGDNVLLSLMNQYTPLYHAKDYKEINRTLTTFEYDSVTDHAAELGIEHCYVQEGKTASKKYVPCFDFRGVRKC